LIKPANIKEWKVKLLLILCSLLIYACFLYPVFYNLNDLLSSITGDALKNYFTFAYHIKEDKSFLEFEGMHYPFGEHVVYTDCQPLLTFILKCLPFTHEYLIGVLHFVLFFSFIVSPLILYNIFRHFSLDRFTSFFVSLAICLLAPQYAKINGGHFGLAYGFFVPLSFLLILRYLKESTIKTQFFLMAYNVLLFFIHPYFGMSATLFTLLTLMFFLNGRFRKDRILKNLIKVFTNGIIPVGFFKGFMLLTDKHQNRPTEPYGSNALVENLDTLLAPDFGPFKEFMESLFTHKTIHYEGHTYLGFFTIICLLVFMLTIMFWFNKYRFRKELTAGLFAAIILLMIAFGWHIILLNRLQIQSASINQFRASSRFAWHFYYMLPVFLTVTFYHSLSSLFNRAKLILVFACFSLIYFAMQLWEAAYFIPDREHVFWKFRNVFSEKYLTQEEKFHLKTVKEKSYQAIVPLPVFYVGSEIYDRAGADLSMYPAMFTAYHTGIPILSSWMSRTSTSETEQAIQLLNSYKRSKDAIVLLDEKDFLIFKTKDILLPDEARLYSRLNTIKVYDSLEIGFISKKDFLDIKLDASVQSVGRAKEYFSDALVFISSRNSQPFIEGNIKDQHLVYELDTNQIKAGTYILSLHYYYETKSYKSFACNLLVTRQQNGVKQWEYFLPMAMLSGFYPGFAVFEQRITIKEHNKYQFVIYGHLDQKYRISNFMLRPEVLAVKVVSDKGDTLYNNYPR
jgi:MFS family permease